MDTDPETVQEEIQKETLVEAEPTDAPIETQEVEKEEEKVPLSALQKERKRRQEAEKRAKLFEEMQEKQLREQRQQQPVDDDQYEAVTKADLKKKEVELLRSVEERSWIRENPEKAREVNEKLEEFLKQRPHLAAAIDAAPNRYSEAWTLMDALTPKQKAILMPKPAAPKKDAPDSPSGMPKATAMNHSVDLMSMSDAEFRAWREAQRKRR